MGFWRVTDASPQPQEPQALCINHKFVGGRLEVAEHTQAIPRMNEGMPPGNI